MNIHMKPAWLIKQIIIWILGNILINLNNKEANMDRFKDRLEKTVEETKEKFEHLKDKAEINLEDVKDEMEVRFEDTKDKVEHTVKDFVKKNM